MVRAYILIPILAVILISVCTLGMVEAWSGSYHMEKEWAKIWINQDGTIDLFYNITISLDSGDNINYVLVGQPTRDFTIGSAADQYGNKLYPSDASQGSDYKVKVPLHTPLVAGQNIWFTVLTNVAHMIYLDNKTYDNVGMKFIPTWWPVSVQNLRVSIVLPSGVTQDTVKTLVNWTSVNTEPDGRLAVFWETQNLSPNQQYPVGVSFPKRFVQSYDLPPSDTNPPSGSNPPIDVPVNFLPAIAMFFFIGVFVFIAVVAVFANSKRQYLSPSLSMETLGILHGLTAVEASYLLDLKPTMIVTEILYSLLKKRAVWVEDTKPSLKLRIMPEFQDMTGTSENPLRYYETDFLKAIREDGTLDEEGLAETVMSLRNNVEDKMRGYCRRDTIDYYRGITAKAWEQVQQAGTPELASNAYDEQLLWLMLDSDFNGRTQTVFHDRVFEPSPMWFWYWYGYRHYDPHPTYQPNVNIPAQSAKPPTILGADFANNIATAVESTSSNIVLSIEKFANAILPMPEAKASHEPARSGATCVCACHACACACACVSCACACASGGVG
jgi:hypothetical protein